VTEEPAPTFTLIVDAVPEEGGEVTGSGEYESGETVTITAAPSDGWLFEGWFRVFGPDDEAFISEELQIEFEMPAENVVIEGRFVVEPGITDADVLSISMYPNPARDIVYLQSNELIKEIRVFDMTGKLVYSEDTEVDNTEISLSGIEPGMYFVRIYTESGITIRKLQIAR